MLKEMRLDAEGKNMPSNASELDYCYRELELLDESFIGETSHAIYLWGDEGELSYRVYMHPKSPRLIGAQVLCSVYKEGERASDNPYELGDLIRDIRARSKHNTIWIREPLYPEIYWDYDEVLCFKCNLSEGCECCFC